MVINTNLFEHQMSPATVRSIQTVGRLILQPLPTASLETPIYNIIRHLFLYIYIHTYFSLQVFSIRPSTSSQKLTNSSGDIRYIYGF